jgi:hypothetical protein
MFIEVEDDDEGEDEKGFTAKIRMQAGEFLKNHEF